MYDPNHHPLTPSSSNPHPTQNQHAFGHHSDHSDTEEVDQDLGFQVYRDQPSNARYLNLATLPSSISPTKHSFHPSSHHHQPVTPLTPTDHPHPPPSYHHPPNSSLQISNLPSSYPQAPPADLVPIPALGSDWDRNESKRDNDWEGKDKSIDRAKWTDRKNKVLLHTSHVDHRCRDFFAGRLNLAGWFTRWIALALALFLIISAALLSYFLVPRLPTLAYNNETTLLGDSSNDLNFEALEPVSFRFNAKINLAMEAHKSYVRPKTSSLDVILKDLSSSSSPVEVARGSLSKPLSISNQDYTPFDVDLNFRYSANSTKDLVWNAWHQACGHKWPGKEDRPTIQIGILVQFSIQGLIGTFSTRTILNNVSCPVELSASAA